MAGLNNLGTDIGWLFGKPPEGSTPDQNPWKKPLTDWENPINPFHFLYTPGKGAKQPPPADPRDISKTPLGPAQEELTKTRDRTRKDLTTKIDAFDPTNPNSGYQQMLTRHNALINEFKANWGAAKDAFKVGAGQAAQRTITGLWGQFHQQASENQAKLREMGVPEDQIAGQMYQAKMSTAFEVGRTLTETGVAIKTKILDFDRDMNAKFADLGASLEATAGGVYSQSEAATTNLLGTLTNMEASVAGTITEIYKYWMDMIGPGMTNSELAGL